ncbi:hypothetical protein E4U42_006589 [Claviceps africana]|uniref:Uncharacterized protein n=1 Tax=Claviceps africana TaxID=83212 RepID=A0A8K0J2S8_9HYPO|nr:hypothetical protein E4U42_006589 [Claviceps africana]
MVRVKRHPEASSYPPNASQLLVPLRQANLSLVASLFFCNAKTWSPLSGRGGVSCDGMESYDEATGGMGGFVNLVWSALSRAHGHAACTKS